MTSVIYLTDTRYGQSGWHNPSARHRCYHYADALLSIGYRSAVVPMEQVSVSLLQQFDHAIFHRPVHNKRFMHALNCCQSAGLILHADYDDLIFHPDFALYSPMHISAGKVLHKVEDQFKRTYAAANCFKSFLISTVYLADKARDIFPESCVTVLPNSLPRTFRRPEPQRSRRKKLTIGYFPGSRGHSEDLKSIFPVLKSVLNENVRMLIVGRMNEDDYADMQHITHFPFADYTAYLRLLSQVDVSVAPLLDNEFNQSKSAVKLIESVAVGTPIVASQNIDMFDHDNQLSYLVSSDVQWQIALSDVLENVLSTDIDDQLVEQLRHRFSVSSRLPVLKEHLQCVA